jgi:hypothetical protein
LSAILPLSRIRRRLDAMNRLALSLLRLHPLGRQKLRLLVSSPLLLELLLLRSLPLLLRPLLRLLLARGLLSLLEPDLLIHGRSLFLLQGLLLAKPWILGLLHRRLQRGARLDRERLSLRRWDGSRLRLCLLPLRFDVPLLVCLIDVAKRAGNRRTGSQSRRQQR